MAHWQNSNGRRLTHSLAVAARAEAWECLEDFRRWLRGDRNTKEWLGPLPPNPDLREVLTRYRLPPEPKISAVAQQLQAPAVASPLSTHQHVRLNVNGACVLIFSATATTRHIAQFLCCVLHRMREACDRAMPYDKDDIENR